MKPILSFILLLVSLILDGNNLLIISLTTTDTSNKRKAFSLWINSFSLMMDEIYFILGASFSGSLP